MSKPRHRVTRNAFVQQVMRSSTASNELAMGKDESQWGSRSSKSHETLCLKIQESCHATNRPGSRGSVQAHSRREDRLEIRGLGKRLEEPQRSCPRGACASIFALGNPSDKANKQRASESRAVVALSTVPRGPDACRLPFPNRVCLFAAAIQYVQDKYMRADR